MIVIIDRFEGDFAVCEQHDRTMIDIQKGLLPADAKEGDVLSVEGDQIIILHQETDIRSQKVAELTKDIWA